MADLIGDASEALEKAEVKRAIISFSAVPRSGMPIRKKTLR